MFIPQPTSPYVHLIALLSVTTMGWMTFGCQPDRSTTPSTQTSSSGSTAAAATAAPTTATPPSTHPTTQPPQEAHEEAAKRVLDAILTLETSRDVTCWTSFRQLDSFIATKQYSPFATLSKIAAVKTLVHALWLKASTASRTHQVDKATLVATLGHSAPSTGMAQGNPTGSGPGHRGDIRGKAAASLPEGLGAFADKLGMKNFHDYRTTSEHWRVVLSLLHDELLDPTGLKPLTPNAQAHLTEIVTWLSLDLLQTSGRVASRARNPFIEAHHVRTALTTVSERWGLSIPTPSPSQPPTLTSANIQRPLQQLTRTLIEHKIKALHAYNTPTGTLETDLQRVLRNPIAPEVLRSLLAYVTGVARFVSQGYDAANITSSYPFHALTSTVQGQDLTKRRSDYIDPIYVENILMAVFPHIVLPNADVRFRLAPSPLGGPAPTEDPSTTPPTKPTKEVRVEGYRMDAIRDTAIHWQLLKQVWEERPFAMDPFAAEVLSENLSVILTLFIDLLAEPEHRSSDLGDRTLVMPRDDQPIPW
ncbi:MAG: hypothetical protein AAFX99_12650, partial [Myxococcota bacterium]